MPPNPTASVLAASQLVSPLVSPQQLEFAPSQLRVLQHMRVLFREGSHLMVTGYTGVGKSVLVAQLVRECCTQVPGEALHCGCLSWHAWRAWQ